MKRGYSDRLAELELRLMNHERKTGCSDEFVRYVRERRKLFVVAKDARKVWTRKYW